jgi:hypothetical protein
MKGAVPGDVLFPGSTEEFRVTGFAIPDIRVELILVRRIGWLDRLLDSSSSRYVLCPVYTPVVEEKPMLTAGDVYYMEQTPWLSAMEDLEYVRIDPVTEWRPLKSRGFRDDLKGMLRGIRPEGYDVAVVVSCIESIPMRYAHWTAGSQYSGQDTQDI